LFCRIISGELSANIVYQDADVMAFRDINPVAPTHIVIVPRLHIENTLALDAVTAPLLGKMVLIAQKVAADTKSDTTGFRLVMNTGADGGQSVNHLHMHFLAGRRLAWPPG
jgi:histidine triad (HIT) family protein